MADKMQKVKTAERAYFTMLPNIVDDMGLDPLAFRLYAHLRRVAGEKGQCWQSTQTLARACNMSAGSVSKAKQVLLENKLIVVSKTRGTGGVYHTVTICDIWLDNMKAYSPGERSQTESVHTVNANTESVHLVKAERSPGETKKNPCKKIYSEEEPISANALTPVAEKAKRKNQLLPTTPQAKMMFRRVGENQRAKGRRSAKQFPTLECKKKFDAAVIILDGEFETALTKALEQGITKITGVTNYIAKWAQNIRKSQQPNHIKVGT